LAVDAQAQNVGIGVSNPQSKLSVNGTSSSGGLAVGDSSYTSTAGTVAPTNGAIIEGNVGIGTATPIAPLHVGAIGTMHFASGSNVTYFNYNNSSGLTVETLPSSSVQDASALFARNIWTNESICSANGTFTASDARLKNIVGRSDSAQDLEILEKIEVTDYTMKDVVKFGNKPCKKVIAQQVEKVYPAAVTSGGIKGFTFTPDIYSVPESVKTEKPGVYLITLAKAHDLKDGDIVRLITSGNPELNAVAQVVNDKSFTVETKQPIEDKVFVYGKQCTDLKTVDYDAISMLNVSATQELAKRVEALEKERVEQDKRISALQAANEKLTAADSENAKLRAEMEVLKNVVSCIQQKENAGVRTVALHRN
jgi:Chaperone of endosialidase